MTALEGEAILVTGASRGLGKSMALRFAREGARVALSARDEERLQQVADEADGETAVVPADVREPEEVEAAVEGTLDAFGEIDTLVNNAGVSMLGMTDERHPITEVTPEQWDTVLEVNLTGTFLFTRAVLPSMQSQGRGNVVNISSGLGRRAIAKAGAYVASKWGLEGFTRVTAMEGEEYGINANALDPGGRVDTDIWAHLPDEEREEILDPDVMDDAAVLLAAQGPDGVSGESMTAAEWEDRLQ